MCMRFRFGIYAKSEGRQRQRKLLAARPYVATVVLVIGRLNRPDVGPHSY